MPQQWKVSFTAWVAKPDMPSCHNEREHAVARVHVAAADSASESSDCSGPAGSVRLLPHLPTGYTPQPLLR